MASKRSARLKPLSLYPLELTDALKAVLSTPPPERPKKKPKKTKPRPA